MKNYFVFAVLVLSSNVFPIVEQHISQMTLEEKIAQLFIMRFNLDDTPDEFERKKIILSQYQVGGVIFLCPWNPEKQFEWSQELSKVSKIPLIYCADAEYGMFCADPERWGEKIKSIDMVRFPQAMTLGAIKNNELIYEFGRLVGKHCKAFNVHLNFAPVVDVNNNPQNPIIHMRSFGDDPNRVIRKAEAYFKGLQANGILACAKHFCGHGDTNVDSHLTLPIINHSLERLNQGELRPFKYMIDQGIDCIMTGHMYVPAIDDRENRPISLSYRATELLREGLGFQGLIVTDGLDMAGVTNHFSPGEIEKEAVIAGADLLLCSPDVPAGIAAIKEAVLNGEIVESEIDERVEKILRLKEKIDNQINFSSYKQAADFCNGAQAQDLKKKLYENAVTVVYDHAAAIPLEKGKIAVINIGQGDSFFHTLTDYVHCDRFDVSSAAKISDLELLEQDLGSYETIIFAFHNLKSRNRPFFGLSAELVSWMNRASKVKIGVLFATPYALDLLATFDAALVAYDNDYEAQRVAAEILAGKREAIGELPISYSVPKKRSP